jgi:hypothetical protein
MAGLHLVSGVFLRGDNGAKIYTEVMVDCILLNSQQLLPPLFIISLYIDNTWTWITNASDFT